MINYFSFKFFLNQTLEIKIIENQPCDFNNKLIYMAIKLISYYEIKIKPFFVQIHEFEKTKIKTTRNII
jgi:hypothetical protein